MGTTRQHTQRDMGTIPAVLILAALVTGAAVNGVLSPTRKLSTVCETPSPYCAKVSYTLSEHEGAQDKDTIHQMDVKVSILLKTALTDSPSFETDIPIDNVQVPNQKIRMLRIDPNFQKIFIKLSSTNIAVGKTFNMDMKIS